MFASPSSRSALSNPCSLITGAFSAIAAALVLGSSLPAQPANPGLQPGQLRDPNKPFAVDSSGYTTTTRLFTPVFYTGTTTDLFAPGAWSTTYGTTAKDNLLPTIPSDPSLVVSTVTALRPTSFNTGTLNTAVPAGFLPGTVLVLGYKTTDGTLTIPDTRNAFDPNNPNNPDNLPFGTRAPVRPAAGTQLNNVLNLKYSGTGNKTVRVDQVMYFDTYTIEVAGSSAGALTFEMSGQGIVRFNQNDTSSGTSGISGPVNLLPLVVNIGDYGTVAYTGTGQFNQNVWYNGWSRFSLNSSTSVLDLGGALGAYFIGALNGVAGSQVILAKTFTVGTTTFNAATTLVVGGAGYSGVFAGVISDANSAPATANLFGSVSKEGDGNIYLTGNNTYRGTTVVNGGALFINGSIGGAAPNGALNQVTINSAYLGGSGTINSNVVLSGAGYISAGADGGAVGTLTIKGNYTQSNLNSYIIVDIANATNYDRINVSGNLSLLGQVLLRPVSGGLLLPTTYRILQGGGTLTGAFNNLSFNSASSPGLAVSLTLTPTFVYGTNFVDVVLNQGKFSDVKGISANAKAVANQVDAIVATAAPAAQTLVGTLNAIGGQIALDRALLEVSPVADSYWLPFAVSASMDLAQRVQDRALQQIDFGDRAWSVFAGASVLSNALKAQNGAESVSGNVYRYYGGLDRRLGNTFEAGLVYSTENTTAKTDHLGGSGKVKGKTFGVYGDYRLGKWQASGLLHFGSDDYTSRRPVFLAGLGQYATGKTSGSRVGVTGDVSRNFAVGYGALVPYGSLNYLGWKTDAFSDAGTNLPLSVDSQKDTSIIGKFGVRWTNVFKIHGMSFRSVANLGYESELGDANHALSSSINGSPYSVRIRHTNGGYVLSAGAEADILRNFTLGFGGGRESGLHGLDKVNYYGNGSFRF